MPTGSYDVFSEHDHLHRLVDRLQAWVERRDQLGAEWLSGLCSRIEKLNEDLVPHFRGEETMVFSDIRTRIPRFVAAVDILVEQHRRMEKDLSKIGEQAKNLDLADKGAASDIVEQLSKVLRLLSVHEQQEIELILSVYGQDLGEP
jgi:iron-sulfur cluster repair protein YtfE (RIC family)